MLRELATQPELSRYLRLGSLTGALNPALTVALSLVLVPLLIHIAGVSLFGQWALVLLVVEVAGATDLGVSKALVLALSRPWPKEQRSRAAATGCVYYFLLSTLYLSLGITVAILKPQWLGDRLGRHTAPVALAFGLTGAIVTLTTWPRALLEASRKVHVVNLAFLCTTAAVYGAATFVAASGGDIVWMAWSSVAAYLLILLGELAILSRLTSFEWPRLSRVDAGSIVALWRETLPFAGLSAVTGLLAPANRSMLMVLGGGNAAFGLLDLAMRVGRAGCGLLNGAASPLYSALTTANQAQRRLLYKVARHYTVVLFGFLVVGTALYTLYGKHLLALFLSPSQVGAVYVASWILLVSNGIYGVAEPFVKVLWSQGRAGFTLGARATQLLLNVFALAVWWSGSPILRVSRAMATGFVLAATIVIVGGLAATARTD